MIPRRLAPSLVIVASCHATPARVSRIDPPDPDSNELWYDKASEHAQHGDRNAALAALRTLDARGWSFCPADRDMPGLTDLAEYRELCGRMKERAPKVQHAALERTLDDPALAPEGIAYDEERRWLFVGSMTQRKILQINADGSTRVFATPASGLLGVLGLRVDTQRRRLWAATSAIPSMADFDTRDAGKAALLAFDLDSGAVQERLTLQEGEHLLNDVAVAPDGTAYVTDTAAGAVWRHSPADRGLVPFLPAGSLRYPNGIACDDKRVFVAHLGGVTVVAPGGKPSHLATPPGTTLGGLDGLYVDGDVLFGVQNGFGSSRIIRADLDASHARALRVAILESAHPALETPTTAALLSHERRLLVLVPGDNQPTVILSVPMDP